VTGVFSELGLLGLVYPREPTTKNNLKCIKKESVGGKFSSIRPCGRRHTFPVLVFFTSNATSVVPSGAFFTSQTLVSSPSPGITGAVKRTPKYRNADGMPPPTALRIARAANPNVDRPCRITPSKPASEPTRGSVFHSEILCVSRRRGGCAHRYEAGCNRPRDGRSEPVRVTFGL
jgi:hypothetical protein